MMSLKLIAFNILLLGVNLINAQSNTYLPPKETGYNYPPPTPSRPPIRPPGPPGVRPPTGPPSRPGQPPADHVHEPGMPFDFQYDVKDTPTQNDYSHKANSDGDVTTGEYRVQLPDGRTQIVRYTADWKTGYHADVSYEGEPTYPAGPSGPSGPGGRPGGGGGYRY